MNSICAVNGCKRLAHFHIPDGGQVKHYCEEHAEKAVMVFTKRTGAKDGMDSVGVSVTVSFACGETESLTIGAKQLQRIPRAICQDLMLLPIKESPDALTVAASEEPSAEHLEMLRFIANQEIEVRIATRNSLANAIILCAKLDWR